MYVDGVRVLECSGVLLFCCSSIMSASSVRLSDTKQAGHNAGQCGPGAGQASIAIGRKADRTHSAGREA